MPAAATKQQEVQAPKNKGGRPRKNPNTPLISISYGMTPELASELAMIAKRKGVSASDLVRQAVTSLIQSELSSVANDKNTTQASAA